MVYNVKHITASGQIGPGWELNVAERRIYVAVLSGSLLKEFSVAICDAERPRVGAHPIVRVNDETWRVLQLRYWIKWKNGVEYLDATKCPIADDLNVGDGLVLTNTPRAVSEQLEAL